MNVLSAGIEAQILWTAVSFLLIYVTSLSCDKLDVNHVIMGDCLAFGKI